MDKWTFGKIVKKDSEDQHNDPWNLVADVMMWEIKKLAHHRCHACDGYGHIIDVCPTMRKLEKLFGKGELQ